MKKNMFHEYLLGESIKHIFIRLMFILLIIIFVWFGILLIIIIYVRYHKRKQMEKFLFNQTRNDITQLNSSLTSIPSRKLKRKYFFRSNSKSKNHSVLNEIKVNSNSYNLIENNFDINTSSIENIEQETIKSLSNFPIRRYSIHHILPSKQNITTKRRHASLNDADIIETYLPLVMITDTNISYTNIVELETFEDKQRLMTDIEKQIKQQLKTPCRPRYST